MPFLDRFSAQAQQYAQARPAYPAALFQFLTQAAPGHDWAWDCATGNGQAAVALAQVFARVSATDLSAAQLAHAMPHERIHYSVQPAEAVDLPSGALDLVTVAQALHWFDLPRFFAEVQRVLKPGGLFCAWGYSWAEITPAIDRVVEQSIRAPVIHDWAAQNVLLWNGYPALTAGVMPFQPLTPPASTIDLEWNLYQYVAYLRTWSAVRIAIEREGAGFFEHATEALIAVWGQPETVRRVSMPLTMVAGYR
jgi:SAM-dependent methyltransferase